MQPGLTWSTLASNDFSIRWFDEGYIFGQLNPTLNFQSGEASKFTILYEKKPLIDNLAVENIKTSKDEYDSFETSWGFKRHPLVPKIDEDCNDSEN